MFKITVPCSLRIGPGIDTFALAVDRFIEIILIDVDREEKNGSVTIDRDSTPFVDRENLKLITNKIFRHMSRVFSFPRYDIKVKFLSEKAYLSCLNQNEAILIGIVSILNLVYNLNLTEERILSIANETGFRLECATASFMGNLAIVDRERNNFLTIDWPSEWKISLVKPSEPKWIKKLPKISREIADDMVSKASFFTIAVLNSNSELLAASLQDQFLYNIHRGRIPYLDKLLLTGKNCNVHGLSLLRKEAGIIIIADQIPRKRCSSRIYQLLSTANTEYIEEEFGVEGAGIAICKD
ncbi:MAG: hypothetical protein C0601_08520 [Candidatus Muiribacterium halophilum]|uniref:GHMP kinase N-terminal domain-containing protein n=1 Tax=Muiribacterium halophilum TaxID=2053465 RepID=A0A2N5ZEC3_MUIH1|nr:MAG: hypothetical protein C0601_08520 [Candidatus Muirbacterium halophilum]